MRGTIKHYHVASGRGALEAKSGQVHAFTRASLLRRSKEPEPGDRIVFRLKKDRVFKAVVLRRRLRDEVADGLASGIVDAALELLIRLPCAMME